MWSYSTSHKRSFNDSDSDDSEEWLPQTPTLDADMGLSHPIPADYFAIDIENMSDVSPMTQVREVRTGRKVAKPVSKVGRKVVQPQPTSAWNPFKDIEVQQQVQQQVQQVRGEVEVNWGMDFGFGQQVAQPQVQESFAINRHQRVLSCGMEAMNTFDFGEAGFLARREDVEMDCS
jgi:hypothetical protein